MHCKIGVSNTVILDLISSELKDTSPLEHCKTEICKWKLKQCPCKFCKTFILNIGFWNI